MFLLRTPGRTVRGLWRQVPLQYEPNRRKGGCTICRIGTSQSAVLSPARLRSLVIVDISRGVKARCDMSAPTRNLPRQESDAKLSESASSLPPIVCPRCRGRFFEGQHIQPLFFAKLVKRSEHPVVLKSVILRVTISKDGSPGRSDLSVGD